MPKKTIRPRCKFSKTNPYELKWVVQVLIDATLQKLLFNRMVWIWQHFVVINKGSASCKHCKKVLQRSGGTKGLVSHLSSAHGITNKAKDVDKHQKDSPSTRSPTTSPKSAKVQKLMPDYVKFRSLEETVARLAAESGLSIRQITRTTYLIKSLKRDFPNRNIPKSRAGMLGLIMNQILNFQSGFITISWS